MKDLAVELQRRLLRADKFDSFLENLRALINDAQAVDTDHKVGFKVARNGAPKQARRKITDAEVRKIRKDYDRDVMTVAQLTRKYERSHSIIKGIGERTYRKGVK